MSAIDDKIASIAALQETTAKQLALLLTRDLDKEIKYGPQYDPNAARRFQSNRWNTQLAPNSITSLVYTAPNSTEEVTVSVQCDNSAAPGCFLRIEMDDNAQFKNIPADFSTRTLFLAQSFGVSGNTYSCWLYRFPCVLAWIRLIRVNATRTAIAWPVANIPVTVGFHGQ